jgi:hypothetical protein
VRSRVAAAVVGALAIVTVAAAVPGSADPSRSTLKLGPTVRLTTPGLTACPAEGEPEVAANGTTIWVAYNDDHDCPAKPGFQRGIGLQRLVSQSGSPTFIALKPGAGETIASDPDLVVAPDGGVYLSAIWFEPSGATVVKVMHVDQRLRQSVLPSPTLDPRAGIDDKPFLAIAPDARGKYRGRVYVAWDDFTKYRSLFRAWDGRRWSAPVQIQGGTGSPDVASAPGGRVAVVTEDGAGHGAWAYISRDGGRTFGTQVKISGAEEPGVLDPSCPYDSTVGTRQRALMSTRAVFDRNGDLHVVLAVGARLQGSTNPSDLPGLSPGAAVVEHVTVRGNRVISRVPVTSPTTAQQWAPAMALLPRGGIAVAWLETADAARTSYDAFIATLMPGERRFTPAERLSTQSSTFPALMEAEGNASCYGIGDYIGMAPTPTGLAVVWPTTAGDAPGVDSDVLVRTAVQR